MYQALYRKWRPGTFDDVIGQKHVTDTLKSELQLGKLSHAYLFTGTRGTGKTTCAKILAKAVNCEAPENGNPCNRCTACVGIDNGSILDVLELDAASNNGVENVRTLRDEAIYTPGTVKKRVYIIDEVHMLSGAAFNALLKIMEEPPEHLIFILATTELHKVPSTILSRCQRFSFKRITADALAERVLFVAENEGINITEEASQLISRMADGAARDALSLLDQCAGLSGTVDKERVFDILGLAGVESTENMLTHIEKRNTASALSLLSEMYSGGKDISAVFNQLSGLVRDVLITVTAPKSGDALVSGMYDSTLLNRFASAMSTARLIYILDKLQELLGKLPTSANQRTDAELCLITLCDEAIVPDMKAFSSRLTRLEVAASSGSFSPHKHQTVIKETVTEQKNVVPEEELSPVEESIKSDVDMGRWPEAMSILKGTLEQIEFAHLSNKSAVAIEIKDEKINISFDDALVNKVLNKQSVKDSIKAAAQHVFGVPLTVCIKYPSSPGSEDRFQDLMKLGERFNNIKIK